MQTRPPGYTFGEPKNTTRQAVMERYHFVFVRDRVGRLADAQEFEHLEFPRRCFPDGLLDYLLAVAGRRWGRGPPALCGPRPGLADLDGGADPRRLDVRLGGLGRGPDLRDNA